MSHSPWLTQTMAPDPPHTSAVRTPQCLCPVCNFPSENFVIQCDDCKQHIHYECSKVPTFQLWLFTKTQRKFTCERCTVTLPQYVKPSLKENQQRWMQDAELGRQCQRVTLSMSGNTPEADELTINTTSASNATTSTFNHVPLCTESSVMPSTPANNTSTNVTSYTMVSALSATPRTSTLGEAEVLHSNNGQEVIATNTENHNI